MTLTRSEFDYIRELVSARTAIQLDAGKEYLALSRLEPLAKGLGVGTVSNLVSAMRADPGSPWHQMVVEAMATNETSFFRDLQPFEVLRTTILPDLISRKASKRTISIWSAACSSGQEPYSVAITLREHFPELADWSVEILASDVSASMIERARRGAYRQVEVNRGLPAHLLLKYFRRVGAEWQVADEVRDMVTFRRSNLIEEWPPMTPMDLILLRNVLIYFDESSKRRVLERVQRVLRPEGLLLLGGAETPRIHGSGYLRESIDGTIWYRNASSAGRTLSATGGSDGIQA